MVDLFNSMEMNEERLFGVDAIKRSWNTAKEKAGIADLRFHDLRHDFASQLVMSVADLVSVKEMLGHSQLTTTQRYAHLSQEHKQNAVEKLVTLQRKPADAGSSNVLYLEKK